MRLLAKAYTNEEIARRLAIPVNDVAELIERHDQSGLVSRLQVIAYVQSRGWQ
jgi:DNA-binding CsgD family transcriptional regulator